MSDTSPTNQAALLSGHRPTSPARTPRHSEIFCAFDHASAHIVCKFLDDGVAGIDVQFWRGDEFLSSRRCPARAFAIVWAEQERRAIEANDRDALP